MAEMRSITKEDIYLKARLTAEGVRVQMPDVLPDPSNMEKVEVVIPDKLDMDEIDGILDLMMR